MNRFGLRPHLAAATALALVLAGCNENDRGRVDAPDPAPLAELAAATDLPFAEPSSVDYYPSAEGYQWAERAYGLQRAVHDTPPDYGFYYEGEEPLVWEMADERRLYAEPWDDGYRYYYYEPGAAYPYFIRDDDYGYAYAATGLLIAVFDARGRYLPSDVVYRVAPMAGRYYARGRDLRNAAAQAPRIQVSERTWSTQAPRVTRSADPWLRAAREEPRWREWRDRNPDREMRRFVKATERQGVPDRRRFEQADRRDLARAPAETVRPPREADRREARVELAAQRQHERQAQSQRAEAQRAQIQQRDRAQAEQQRRQAERREQVEVRERQQAEAQRAQHAQMQQRQQAKPRQEVREGRRREKPIQQAQARAAEQQGKPAAAHERGKAHGKKD